MTVNYPSSLKLVDSFSKFLLAKTTERSRTEKCAQASWWQFCETPIRDREKT